MDRLNKRGYYKLQAETRTHAALATALAGITTSTVNLPGTLGIRTLLQGGLNALQVLVSYEHGTFDSAATNTLDWLVAGVDAGFTPHPFHRPEQQRPRPLRGGPGGETSTPA